MHEGVGGLTDFREIGRGGFGTVYAAIESDFGRTVALKVLSGDFDEQSRVRFDRERQAMGSLSGHPNIVTVHRSGLTDRGQPYLVMEYLEAGSLADHLKTHGRLTGDEVVRIGLEVGDALATAHEAGVLHRDVKPGNLLRSRSGVTKLGDFGIARLHGAPETRSAVVTASVAHAPPEVLSGARPDERADQYSLGSTLFELAWGQPAFHHPDDESLVPMLARIMQDPPADLTLAQLSPAVAEVIARSLRKDPNDRYQSVRAFVDALREAATTPTATQPTPESVDPTVTHAIAPLASAPPPNQTETSVPAVAATSTAGAATSTAAAATRTGLWLALGAVGVVLVGLLGAVALLRGDDPEPTDPTLALGDTTTSMAETTVADPSSTTTASTPTTTAPPTTTSPPTTPPSTTQTAGATASASRFVSNDTGSITLLVPETWAEQTGDPNNVLATTDLDLALADDWVEGVLVQAYLNNPTDNPGGFAPDATLDALAIDSQCVEVSRVDYADTAFLGRSSFLSQCGGSGLSILYVVASPPDLSYVVLVGIQYFSPLDDAVVDLILNSIVFNPALL